MFVSNAAVAQVVRAFASRAEGRVFESQVRQTLVLKTSNDRITAKRSATSVNVKGPVSATVVQECFTNIWSHYGQ